MERRWIGVDGLLCMRRRSRWGEDAFSCDGAMELSGRPALSSSLRRRSTSLRRAVAHGKRSSRATSFEKTKSWLLLVLLCPCSSFPFRRRVSGRRTAPALRSICHFTATTFRPSRSRPYFAQLSRSHSSNKSKNASTRLSSPSLESRCPPECASSLPPCLLLPRFGSLPSPSLPFHSMDDLQPRAVSWLVRLVRMHLRRDWGRRRRLGCVSPMRELEVKEAAYG